MADGAAKKRGFAGVISAGPLGTVARLLWFILLCAILFVIGLVKAAVIGPLATLIFLGGDMAVVIGLWPWHVALMFRALAMTKKLGVILKTFLILLLPIPLLVWPIVAAVGSLLTGLGYGVGQPLVATFEAVGEHRENKLYHTFADGTVSTVTGAFKFVRDFYDIVYHSVPDSVKEFRLGEPKNGKPVEIKLHELPLCALVGILGVIVDTPAISIVALCKMPIMLYKGWRKLLGELVSRNGSCLEAACVPLAGLAIVFWPLIVVASAVSAFLCSPLLGLYSAIVVYQEMSYKCGLKYIVAVVAEFDEYSSDVIHTREGSCLPRPNYRKSKENLRIDGAADIENGKGKPEDNYGQLAIPQLNTQKSLKQTLKEVKLVHILANKFTVIDKDGRSLILAGVLKQSDIDAALKGDKVNGKIVLDGLPAYCLLWNLIRSVKAKSSGILLNDGTVVNMSNKPSDRLSDWFFEPLLVLKDQICVAKLVESEEHYLEKLILMGNDIKRMESWQNGGVEPEDDMRRGELQALARRIQGISTSISRLPTHRRRMEGILKGFQAYKESLDNASRNSTTPNALPDSNIESGILSNPKAVPDSNKSMRKMRSYNIRNFLKEGSKRFLPTTVAAAEKRGNSDDIPSNAIHAV